MKARKPAIMALIVASSIGVFLFCPVDLSFGTKTFRKSLTRLNGDHSMWPDVFNRTGWDGPTGSRDYADIYALRIGDWLFRFDAVTERTPHEKN